MTRATLALAAIFFGCFTGVSHGGDWLMYRGNAARTASTQEALPQSLNLRWEYRATNPPQPAWPRSDRMTFDRAYQPVIGSGVLLFGSSYDGTVRALETKSGRLRWTFFTQAPVRFAPVIWRDRALVASDDGWLYALRLADGKLLWKKRGGPSDACVLGNNRVISKWPLRGGPVVADDVLYFAAGIWPTDGIYLYAIDPESGKEIWRNDRAGSIYMAQPHGGAYAESGVSAQGYLVASGEHLFVPTGRAVPAAFSRSDGKFEYFHLQKYGHNGGTPTMAVGDVFFNSGLSFLAGSGTQVGKVGTGELAATSELIFRAAGDKVTAYRWKTETKPDPKGKPVKTRSLVGLWSHPGIEQASSLLVAGTELVIGGSNTVTILNPKTGKLRWQAKVRGNVRGLAVADSSLWVSTDMGALYSFGESTPSQPQVIEPAVTSLSIDQTFKLAVQSFLNDTQITQGFAVDLNPGNGELSQALVANSALHVIAIAEDETQVQAIRQRLDQAGILGDRISVWHRSPNKTGLPNYCADLVVSGAGWRGASIDALQEARRLQRPYGGIVCLDIPSKTKPAIRGALVGGGSWTHQYADPANSLNSGDQIVGGRLTMAWFRDIDIEMPQRHGRGPSPLFESGRLFHQGLNGVIAVNAYNGTELWRHSVPGVLQAYDGDELMGVSGTGGNMCVGNDRVFVRNEDFCEVLDATSGKQLARFQTQATTNASRPPWGFLATDGKRLFGSEADADHVVTYRYVNRGGDMKRLLTESRALFALDPKTGSKLWRYQATESIRHNAIAVAGNRIFLIDRPQAEFDRVKKPKSLEHAFGRLLALDTQSGEIVWQQDEEIFGTLLVAVPKSDILLMSYQPTRFRLDSERGGRMAAFRLSDGKRLWDRKIEYASRPFMHHGTIYAQGGAWDLATGDPRPFAFKRSYGCGVLAASDRLMVFRSATLGYYDLTGDKKTLNYGGMRPGCWINALPVGGVVAVPDASAGCRCSYLNRSWITLQSASSKEAP